MKIIKKSVLIVLITLAFLIPLTGQVFAVTEDSTIKVGYFESGNFIKENGEIFSGYCVDYLEEVANYTGWQYEYVYCEWEDCLDKIENGEIDFMCTIQYTEERAERFAFSTKQLGTEHCLIYANTDADIYYADYKSMDGAKIAMLADTVFEAEISNLEDEKGISLIRVYYDSVEDVERALATGEAELAVVGSIFGYNDAKIVARNDGQPYYCVTSKKNAKLMEQFDDAVKKMNVNNPGFESRLYQRYYGIDMISSTPLFTREQHEYIENADKVEVKLVTNSRPLCYNNNGKVAGVFVELLNLIAKTSGLNIVIEESTNAAIDDVTKTIPDSGFLTLRSRRLINHATIDAGLINSDIIIDTSLSYVKRIEDIEITGRDDYVFAITKEMAYYLPELLMRESSKFSIKYFDTLDECLSAVVKGEADIAIQDSYLIEYMLQKSEYEDKLTEVYGMEVNNGMCLIASKDNTTLIDIINKTLDYITDDEIKEIVDIEVKGNPYEMTIRDVLYEHKLLISILVIFIVLTFVVYTWLTKRMANLKVQKKEYELLQKKIQQDQLTGVYNKAYFYERAADLITNIQEDMCIVLVDIVNFKVINDLYGIENGDKLLKYVAQKLKEIATEHGGIVARFNADHFYLCIKESVVNEENFVKRFKRTPVDNIDVYLTYGVFMIRDLKHIPINIMCDRAGMAIHALEGKNVGEYIFYYTDEEREKLLKQKEIEADMEKALEEKQFCVYVQPKYDVVENKLIGGEALARWLHPEKGMISPGEFIPVFEKNGFIRFLDYCIWEETCKLISECKKKNLENYPISINVSRIHFFSKELKKKLLELLEKYNLEASELELEITETVYVEDSELINKKITELQELGFKIAMDDFGSGYSSLNMLKEVPLDILKMDLKFLDSSENIAKSHKILGTLIELAKSLDLKVVVEGVETEGQVEFLKGLGNLSAQGYYFAKPLTTENYKKLLEQTEGGL